jgi:two-component system OmpR family response regulator
MRILFIEDEPRLREALCRGLSEEGHEAVGAATGAEGLGLAEQQSFDVIVCDILLPEINGFALVRRLREQAVWTPVLMLTAKDGEWDEAEALDAGADGYLRALARRGAKVPASSSEVLRAGDLILDLRARRCARGGTEVELSAREFSLLAELLSCPGQALSKEELMRRVWGPEFAGDPNIVEVYVGYLRKKLDLPFGRRSIETVRGYGYRLAAEDHAIS